MVQRKRNLRLFVVVLCLGMVFGLMTAAASGTEEPKSKAAGPVTVKWWTPATTSQHEMLSGKAKILEERFPDLTVEITVINGWTDEWRKILTAVAGGEPPNGARLKDYMVTDLARRNALLDCTGFYKRDREKMESDDYFDSLLNPFWIKGKLYGLPWHVYYYVLYQNNTLMKQAGFSKSPETWEELAMMGKKITDKSKNIYGTQMQTYAGNDAYMAKVTEMYARQHSDNPHTDPWDVLLPDAKPKFNLTSASLKSSLNMWLDLIYEQEVCLPPELSTMPNRTEGGLIGFWFDSAIGASGLRKRAKVDFDIAMMPKAKHRSTIVEVNGWAIFANTGNDEMTWELAKFATGPEVDLAWSTDAVYLPKRKTYWNQEPFSNNKDYITARKQLEHPDTVFHRKYTIDWFRVMSAFSEELEKIYYRKSSVDEGLSAAQKKVDDLIKELYQ